MQRTPSQCIFSLGTKIQAEMWSNIFHCIKSITAPKLFQYLTKCTCLKLAHSMTIAHACLVQGMLSAHASNLILSVIFHSLYDIIH